MRLFQLLSLICLINLSFSIHVSHLNEEKLSPPEHRNDLYKILSTPYIKEVKSNVISITSLGGDPTGKIDSTDAFKKAVEELISRKTDKTMSDGIADLGGAVIDLEGGEYVVNDTVFFPNMYGNYHIMDGTIRASDTFPEDKFLVQVGGDTPCTNKQGSCSESVAFSYMMFDGNHKALGNLKIVTTMGAPLGPQMFFTGFVKLVYI